jgi:hypothetical protein
MQYKRCEKKSQGILGSVPGRIETVCRSQSSWSLPSITVIEPLHIDLRNEISKSYAPSIDVEKYSYYSVTFIRCMDILKHIHYY